MFVTICSGVTSSGHHRTAIVVVFISIMEPSACVVGIWVESCPSDVDACVLSSNDKDLSGLISPLPDVIGPFPVISFI